MPNPIPHTASCQQRMEARSRARGRWLHRWPNHCGTCSADTNHKHPCRDCLLRHRCPRCATHNAFLAPGDNRCRTCGYRLGTYSDYKNDRTGHFDGLPPPLYCLCGARRGFLTNSQVAARKAVATRQRYQKQTEEIARISAERRGEPEQLTRLRRELAMQEGFAADLRRLREAQPDKLHQHVARLLDQALTLQEKEVEIYRSNVQHYESEHRRSQERIVS